VPGSVRRDQKSAYRWSSALGLRRH